MILLGGDPRRPARRAHPPQAARRRRSGHWQLAHDHENGVTSRRDRLDAWTVLQAGTTTAQAVAEALYGTPSRPQIEKARRRLERFVKEGHATKTEPEPGGATAYHPADKRLTDVRQRDPSRDPLTTGSRTLTNGSTEPHAPLTHPLGQDPLPTVGGVRDRDRDPTDHLTIEHAEALIAQETAT